MSSVKSRSLVGDSGDLLQQKCTGVGTTADPVILEFNPQLGSSVLRDPQDAVLHRTWTGGAGSNSLDGAYPPLASHASWLANPGNYSRLRFLTAINIKGTTALADDPTLTFRPYVLHNSLYVAGAAAVTYVRPRLKDDASLIKFLVTTDDEANFTDYSTEVNDNTSAHAALDALDTDGNGDYFYIGGPVPFGGAAITIGAAANSEAATLAAEIWTGSTWFGTTIAADGTDSGGATLAVDGQVTWIIPASWTTKSIDGITAYWVRFNVSATLSATVDVEEVELLLPIKAAFDLEADGDDALLFLESLSSVTGTPVYEGTIYASWR